MSSFILIYLMGLAFGMIVDMDPKPGKIFLWIVWPFVLVFAISLFFVMFITYLWKTRQ